MRWCLFNIIQPMVDSESEIKRANRQIHYLINMVTVLLLLLTIKIVYFIYRFRSNALDVIVYCKRFLYLHLNDAKQQECDGDDICKYA